MAVHRDGSRAVERASRRGCLQRTSGDTRRSRGPRAGWSGRTIQRALACRRVRAQGRRWRRDGRESSGRSVPSRDPRQRGLETGRGGYDSHATTSPAEGGTTDGLEARTVDPRCSTRRRADAGPARAAARAQGASCLSLGARRRRSFEAKLDSARRGDPGHEARHLRVARERHRELDGRRSGVVRCGATVGAGHRRSRRRSARHLHSRRRARPPRATHFVERSVDSSRALERASSRSSRPRGASRNGSRR